METEIKPKQELIKLKTLREKLEELSEQKAELKKQFEEQHAGFFKTIQLLEDERIQTEQRIRKWAVDKYDETGEKQFGQIKIRIQKFLNYDEEMAKRWAIDHQLCLALDKKAFEKLAKTQNLAFVTITNEAQATLPSKIEVEENE